MNRFEFLGRIVKEPTIRYTQNQEIIYTNSIAVNRKYSKEQTTDFFNIIAFGKTAEFMQKYMNIKGQQILVEGRIQNRTWENDKGEKQYATDFIVENSYFADTKKTSQDMGDFVPITDDDLPF